MRTILTLALLIGGVTAVRADEPPKHRPVVTSSAEQHERAQQAKTAQAIHLLLLQQAYESRQLTILGISNARAAGHEVNMRIIDNIRPTARYDYNPATGRYDRYVPR